MVFNHYAKYYNLLYADKEYDKEVNFINTLIKRCATSEVKNVLDVGCGTGQHALYMSALGYHITGVDMSVEMINEARQQNIPNTEFYTHNADNFSFDRSFDVITSLFHVLSYQTSNEAVHKMIANISCHLADDGIFIFDFWYAPAVLTKRPDVKIKCFEDDEIKVTRIAEPVLKVNENTVDVHFELLIETKQNGKISVIKEVHSMRYFSLPEIELFLEKEKMKLIYAKEWMSEKTPSDHTWGVCCIAEKLKE
jgi:SAM-dependent methyltransferase